MNFAKYLLVIWIFLWVSCRQDSLEKALLKPLDVKELDLSNKMIGRLPSDIKKLANLEILNLRGNNLSVLPKEIFELKKLQKLNLSENQFQTIPPQIAQLQELNFLVLSTNQLNELPAEIGKLGKLQNLEISWNNLKTLPKELSDLKQLKHLELYDNFLDEQSVQKQFPNMKFEFEYVLEKDYGIYYFNKGLKSYQMKDTLSALKYYTKAIDKSPTISVSYRNRAAIWFDRGDIAKTCADLKQAQKLGDTVVAKYIKLYCK